MARKMPAKTPRPTAAEVGGRRQKAPKEVVKEGLGEYFIYTIEGTETIPNGWAKRLRSLEAAKVPLKIQYRYRPAEYGEQLVRMYLLTNDKDSKLGTTPLPDGTFRLFRQNGRDGLSFLAGAIDQVRSHRRQDRVEPGRRSGGDFRIGQAPIAGATTSGCRSTARTSSSASISRACRSSVNSSVAGWDDHALFAQRVRNYTKKPIDVEIRRTFPGDVVFRSGLPAKNHDYQTVEYTAAVAAGAKAELHYEVVTHQGRNARQNRVVVEAGSSGPPQRLMWRCSDLVRSATSLPRLQPGTAFRGLLPGLGAARFEFQKGQVRHCRGRAL